MSTAQANYLDYGIAEGDSTVRVSNDAFGDAAGLTAGECGKSRRIEQGQQCAHPGAAGKVGPLPGAVNQQGGAWGNVSTTVDAQYMGGKNHTMLFIVNGVSYTVVPGTATEIPIICKEIMDNAKDPHGNGIPYA